MSADEATAAKILRAARMLLDGGGPDAVTMRRVAAAVNLTAMAIYRHYPNRDALLAAVADDAFQQMASRWAQPGHGSVRRRLTRVFIAYLDEALAHPHVFDLAFSHRRPGARRFPSDFRAHRSPTLNIVADLIDEGGRGQPRKANDRWTLAMMLWAHAHGLIVLYRAGRFDDGASRFRRFYRESTERLIDALAI